MTALRRARVKNSLSFAGTYFFLAGACLSGTLSNVASNELNSNLMVLFPLIPLGGHSYNSV